MESLPAGEESSPTMLETNLNAEEFVRAVMAKNRQEMKDILYESCEQAVQAIAHRTLTLYLQSGGSMSSTADSGDGPTLSNIALPTRVQSASSRPSITHTSAPLAMQVPADPRVFGSTSIEDSMPVASPSQCRKVSKVSFDSAAELPLKESINGIAPTHLSKSDTKDTLGTLASLSTLERATAKARVKLVKAHTRKSMLRSTQRASSASRAFRPTLQQRAQGARPTRQLTSGLSQGTNVTNSPPAPAHGIFANAEAMKEKLRAALTETPYDVTDYYSTTGWCQAIARSTILEYVVLSVIAFNALWISVDADLNEATIITDAPPLFQVIDNFFCIFFLFEISARFGAFEVKNNCLRDPWFVFDATMSTMMMLETWLLPILVLFFAAKESGASGTYKDASLLKALRLVRLMRMARVVRLLRALPEMMVVIKGLLVATRAVSCTVLLMLMIIYVFAITFRQITDGTELGRTHFSTVPETMMYLMVQSTMPDLTESVYDIRDEGLFFAVCFLVFIFITSITVMNMLVGILVGVIDTVASVEKEQLMLNFVKDHLLTLLTAGDTDNDGLISKFEFCTLIQTPDAIRSFTAMGVDVVNLVDLADFLFTDETVGLPFGDFMEMIMQLRGSNQATVKDVVDLRRFVTMEMRILFSVILDRLQPEIGSKAHKDAAGNKRLPSLNLLNDVVPGLHFQKTMSCDDKPEKARQPKKVQQAEEGPAPNGKTKSKLSLLETVIEQEDEGRPPQPRLDFLTSANEQEDLTVEERKADGDLETCKKRRVKITRKPNNPRTSIGSLTD